MPGLGGGIMGNMISFISRTRAMNRVELVLFMVFVQWEVTYNDGHCVFGLLCCYKATSTIESAHNL